jgi:hypothetical protein
LKPFLLQDIKHAWEFTLYPSPAEKETPPLVRGESCSGDEWAGHGILKTEALPSCSANVLEKI